MNYLNICQITTKNNDSFSGIIIPKKYNKWSELLPEILLFEGINQFGVKSVKLYCSELNIRFVPVQWRNVSIKTIQNYEEVFIKGKVNLKERIYEIEFEVVSEGRYQIALGAIYVAGTSIIQSNIK